MNFIYKILLIFLFFTNVYAVEEGETEITTEEGIEVFQNEKFYLLKKNVSIRSQSFNLYADNVKIIFDKSLYDIIELNATGKVKFDSPQFKMKGSGEKLNFRVQVEELKVEGHNSELVTEDIKMYSNGFVKVNNQSGEFFLKGPSSKLINEKIIIEGESIDGVFSSINDNKEVEFLNVNDEDISYVKNNETEMYAKKIKFNNVTSIIELIDKVTIIRNEEKITGDYGTLDTKNNSYKINSSNQNKVKVIIKNNE